MIQDFMHMEAVVGHYFDNWKFIILHKVTELKLRDVFLIGFLCHLLIRLEVWIKKL